MNAVIRRSLSGAVLVLAAVVLPAVQIPQVSAQSSGPVLRFHARAPTGPAVLRQSLTAIERSLHQVHTDAVSAMVPGKKTATDRFTGDCVMKPHSMVGRFQIHNKHYVGAWSWPQVRGSRTWMRSPQTGNRWKRADSDNTALAFIYVCPAMYASMMRASGGKFVPGSSAYRNTGAATVRGFRTWRLSAVMYSGGTHRTDIYVDQSTRFWIRLVQSSSGSSGGQHEVIDYSRFNTPVRIDLPRQS